MIFIKKINIFFSKLFSLAQFKVFETLINGESKKLHDKILLDALKSYELNKTEVNESIAATRLALLQEFKNKHKENNQLRLLIHLPPFNKSPGGYSLFYNLYESLKFLGIHVELLNFNEDINTKLSLFNPNFFISSDNEIFKKQIDWRSVAEYQKKNRLKIGLTASLEEYGNTSLQERLEWAQNNKIDFFYSFRTQEYLKEKIEYEPYYNKGYQILTIEFGANILIYFPIKETTRDIDFVFLASSNSDKRKRYYTWLKHIFIFHTGFINGPGWSHVKKFATREIHNILYSRAKVGINLHINDSIDSASELNERTYILAACGVPQLIDNPKLLHNRLSSECYFEANNPKEYEEAFKYILQNPLEAKLRAENALKEIYSGHTTLHRADKFINDLLSLKE